MLMTMQRLRATHFVADAFEWQYLSGAKKLTRGLAPALLSYQLIRKSQINAINNDDLEAKVATRISRGTNSQR